MEELIKRLERVIQTGAPDKDGQHPISAETVLEVVKGLYEHGTNLAEVGTDCISRQAAIDAFNTNLNELVVGGEENAKTVENYLNRVLDKIKCLPSAHPKRGRWERGFDGNHAVCSNCQAWWIPFGEGYKTDYHFCPNCGADMRGGTGWKN